MKAIVFLFAGLLLLVSCHHSDHGHEHNAHGVHDEEERGALYWTSYTDQIELFAEADPLCAGYESGVLAHFSSLPDFSPLDSAHITLKLVVGHREYKDTVSEALKKGIYQFQIHPEEAGEAYLVFEIRAPGFHENVKVSGVKVYATQEEASEAAAETALLPPNTSFFSREQAWKIDFFSDYPQYESFGTVIKTLAQVKPLQQAEKMITASTSGLVRFADASLLPGKAVRQGQALLVVETRSLADNNLSVRFAEAQHDFEQARADYERLRILYADQLVSQKEFLQARTNYENKKVRLEHLHDYFNESGQPIDSPLKGFVHEVFVQPGAYVEAGQLLLSVVNDDYCMLQAEVQQKYAPILPALQYASIHLPGREEVYTLTELNGRFLSHGKSVNDDNYLLPVSLKIQNRGRFVVGSFVDLYLLAQSDTKSLTVPNTALLEDHGQYYVYVQINPENFEKRLVETGGTDGVRTQINGGLSADERVVTKGAVCIHLNQSTAGVDAHSGHVH